MALFRQRKCRLCQQREPGFLGVRRLDVNRVCAQHKDDEKSPGLARHWAQGLALTVGEAGLSRLTIRRGSSRSASKRYARDPRTLRSAVSGVANLLGCRTSGLGTHSGGSAADTRSGVQRV